MPYDFPHQGIWLTQPDRKSTRLNSSHLVISYAVFCLKKKINAARTCQETGFAPGVDEPEIYRQRSGHIVLPTSVEVWEATRELRMAFRTEAVEIQPGA